MGNNVAGNLTATAKLLRRITRSAAKWAVKEEAPKLPEAAIESLRNLEAAQNAASAGVEGISELSGTALGGGLTAGTVELFGISVSVAVTNIVVIAAFLSILAGGLYIGYRIKQPTINAVDGKPVLINVIEAQKELEAIERAREINVLQDMITNPSDADPEVLRDAEKLLKSLQAKQTDSTEPQTDDKPDGVPVAPSMPTPTPKNTEQCSNAYSACWRACRAAAKPNDEYSTVPLITCMGACQKALFACRSQRR
jgi:hypothetical protein